MAKNVFKYVYVVDKDENRIIDTASGVTGLKKRIASKKVPYPANVEYLQVNSEIGSALTQLDTDELIGFKLITNAIVAGIVADKSIDDVIKVLVEKNIVNVVEV